MKLALKKYNKLQAAGWCTFILLFSPLTSSANLSLLAEPPAWHDLPALASPTLDPAKLRQSLAEIYLTGDTLPDWLSWEDEQLIIHLPASGEQLIIPYQSSHDNPSWWQKPSERPAPTPGQPPLHGLHIALDPGHIGGQWGLVEERHFSIGDDLAVQEGDLTLLVAKKLLPRLESLGARVTLLRTGDQPVTHLRPDDFADTAAEILATGRPFPGIRADTPRPKALSHIANLLFYRVAEIRARANLVNQTVRPDLVIALHFNGTDWPDPSNPSLVEDNHFHVIINGAYLPNELELHDIRWNLLQRWLQGVHEAESQLAPHFADAFAATTGLPAYTYKGTNAKPAGNNPYIWARNLLANRLYQCPVIYLEPYVANSRQTYPRIQAGDYTGKQTISGTPQISIFEEYVQATEQALLKAYSADKSLK